MNKPVGGRGLKANYDTTHSRIPIRLKSLIDTLSNSYREIASTIKDKNPIVSICQLLPLEIQKEIILTALNRYIEEESQRDRKGNQYGKELKPKARTWDKFNQFKEWVKNNGLLQTDK